MKMRKVFSMILCLILIAAAAGSCGEPSGRSSALDTLFQSGELQVKNINAAAPSSPDKYEMNEEAAAKAGLLVDGDVYESLKTACENRDFNILSLSRSGYAAIFLVGKIPVAMYDFSYHVIYPSSVRGVEDVYSNLQTVYSPNFDVNISEQGIVFSDDDKYAVLYNYEFAGLGRFFQDPVIIDLTTGEMILTATYSNDIKSESFGAVIAACFSANNRFLYYVLYQGFKDEKYALYRCNLDTGITEYCCPLPYDPYGSSLEASGDGTLFMMDSGSLTKDGCGLIRIWKDGGEWKTVKEKFHQFSGSSFRFAYSDNSGYAVCSSHADLAFEFACFRPDDADTYDTVYAIDMGTSQVIRRNADDQDERFTKSTCYKFYQMRLSPDGFYAMAYVYGEYTSDRHMFMIDLETMECREVTGFDPGNRLSPSLYFKPVFEWNVDGILLAGQPANTFYKFEN